MSALQDDDLGKTRRQILAKTVLLFLPTKGQNSQSSQLLHLRQHGHRSVFRARRQPVRQMKLKVGRVAWPQQDDQLNPRPEIRGEPIDHKRKHIRTERVAYENDFLFSPCREKMAQN